MIGHDVLGHDLPAVLVGDLLQQLAQSTATRPPRIRRRYFARHTSCSPIERTLPECGKTGAQTCHTNYKTGPTSRAIPHCSPAPTPSPAKAASPLGVKEWKQFAPDDYAKALRRVPLKRIGDVLADVGALVAFLLSTDATFITAQTIHVDGGIGFFR